MSNEYCPQLDTTSETPPERQFADAMARTHFREIASELSLEGWPRCQQEEKALCRDSLSGVCHSCKGEKMLDVIRKKFVKFGLNVSLCQWIKQGGHARTIGCGQSWIGVI